MSPFEYLLGLYSIVAGLGVALLVRSVGQLIEARDRVRLYWVHSGWLCVIFVAHVVSWFSVWRLAGHTPWTVLQALLLLCVPILLYLVSHLAVPELEPGRTLDMRHYYFRHAQWSQSLLLAAVVVSTLVQQLTRGGCGFVLFVPSHVLHAAVAAILAPGIVMRSPAVHGLQVAGLLLLIAAGVAFVSAPIG